MKKIKLVSAIALASTLVLSGCGKEEHTHKFSSDWKSDATNHWHECECGEKSDVAAHKDSDNNGKCDVCEYEVGITPTVKSIKITGSVSSLEIGQSVELTATISTVGEAEKLKDVVWSTDSDCVSFSNIKTAKTKVTAVKSGKAKITVTSVYDSKKSAYVTIEVIDKGPRPELLDDGYSYSREFPSSQAKAFAGADIPAIAAKEGFYFQSLPEDDQDYARFEIITESKYFEEFEKAIENAHFYAYYSSNLDDFLFIDPAKKAVVSFASYYTDDTKTDTILVIDVYKGTSLFKDVSETGDTAWNASVQAALDDLGVELPFIKLGDGYKLYVDGYVNVYDNNIDFNKLDNYEDILVSAGFEKIPVVTEEESYYVYVKDIDAYSYEVVDFYFSEYGNEIYVYVQLNELDEFPATELAGFVDEVVRSNNSVPSYSSLESTYTWSVTTIDVGEKSSLVEPCAVIDVTVPVDEEISAYKQALVDEGFVLNAAQTVEKMMGTTAYTYEKGRLSVSLLLSYGTREPTEEEYNWAANMTQEAYDLLTDAEKALYSEIYYYASGMTDGISDYDNIAGLQIGIYAIPGTYERAGVYFEPADGSVYIGETLALAPNTYEVGEEPTISYTSSNEAVATVSAEGVVTGVANGVAEITAKVTYETVDYTDTFTVSVSKRMSVADVLEEVGLDLELPEPADFELADYDFEEDYGLSILCDTTDDNESYGVKLEAAGFTVYEDDWGYVCGTDGVYSICLYEDFLSGGMVLEVTFAEESGTTEELYFEDLGFDNQEVVTTVEMDCGVTITFSKGTNNVEPKYFENDSGVRCYGSNTITFTAADGDLLTEIDFLFKSFTKPMTANCGTFDDEECYWYSEEGVESVTFTFESGKGNDPLQAVCVSINGGGSGGGGGGGGETEDGEEFFLEVLATALGRAPVYGEDYFDDDGIYGFMDCTDLTKDIDNLYDILSELYYCTEPAIDSYETYDFSVYSEDFSFVVDIYSYEDDEGLVIEFDLYDISELL